FPARVQFTWLCTKNGLSFFEIGNFKCRPLYIFYTSCYSILKKLPKTFYILFLQVHIQ
ncbi:hypothetical protein X975_05178, partial [Stegodyphus mimosarum]